MLFFAAVGGQHSAHGEGPLSAEETVAAMKVFDGLQAQVFAAEPMITNPTNITVDQLGRVWVCDVVNYRGNQGKRPAGDRILVLEDDDGDGRADRSTVFYQGPDVDSALGICVLGSKVIVSCSPDVFVLTDEDGDGRADRKELLYTKTGKRQHDHSAHAFVFGPDGCLYWNVGNENRGVYRADGEVVVDLHGREVRNNGKPYRHGMAFRQTLTGDRFEVLAHNLRNSYELTVDAFGEVWFTDNDDDGHRGTRFCVALDGGNYGYTEELTGQGWRTGRRTGMSAEAPLRHWHQNDPGSIPNVLNNGSGSPSGIEAYEDSLLPARLRGGVVHCEPGHNTVRVYLPQPSGAGYTAETIELIDGRGDPWFRPVDAATAPDGSLLIADWYDPGVGGHRQADVDRGRIYRVAPREAKYLHEPADLSDPVRACRALCSGNNSVRYAAWMALADGGAEAEAALRQLSQSENAQSRARAFWLLARLPDKGTRDVMRAAGDVDQRVRAAAARMTRELNTSDAKEVIENLATDSSALVRRAAALALRHFAQEDFAPMLWARLARRYDGVDRWYLEALGLAAESDWDRYLDAWLDNAGDDAWRTPAGRKLIWRSRGAQTMEKLIALLDDPTTHSDELPGLLRAIDFNTSEDLDQRLIDLADRALRQAPKQRPFVAIEALRRVQAKDVDARLGDVLARLLDELPHQNEYASLVMQFRLTARYDDLLSMALGSLAETDQGVRLIRFLVKQGVIEPIKLRLKQGGIGGTKVARMLALSSESRALELLLPLVNDASTDIDLRREAVRALAANKKQAEQLVKLAETRQLESDMQSALLFALRTSPWKMLRQRIEELQPEHATTDAEQLPIAEWMKLSGDAQRGQQLFAGKANCATCHKVGDTGKEVGPALTEIGSKLSRAGLYESLLFPSAAISHNYESYLALTDAGMAVTGVLVSLTDEIVVLKNDKAVVHELPRDELEEFHKLDISLMPNGQHKLLTPQELADVVAYMRGLKQKSQAGE